MNKEQLLAAIQFGTDTVAEYKERGEEVPGFVYDKIIKLQAELIQLLSAEQ